MGTKFLCNKQKYGANYFINYINIQVGKHWVASEKPLGDFISDKDDKDMLCVSAGMNKIVYLIIF
jgi:hypothetical protein